MDFEIEIPVQIEPEPEPEANYIAMCLRRGHNDAYKQWELVDIVKYESNINNNNDKYLQFLIGRDQKNKILDALKTKKIFVDANGISEQTPLDGWAIIELSSEIQDLRYVPNYYDFVIEEER